MSKLDKRIDFLPKDPQQKVKAITERLYNRLTMQRAWVELCIAGEEVRNEVEDELKFLERILDWIEKSEP